MTTVSGFVLGAGAAVSTAEPPPGAAGTVRACVFTAESQKGHARYARELLTALAEARRPGFSVELVTSADLAPPYRSSLYPINLILPPLKERNLFTSRLHWAVSRVMHYASRDQSFLRWLRGRSDLNLVHFQEYTPWLAPWHYRLIRRRGLAVVVTVHNITNFAHLSRLYMRCNVRCYRSAWRACSALLVHTDGLRASLSEFLGPGHPPIFVTPHAVWEERSGPPTSPEPPRPGGPCRLLYFGAIRPNKGLHVLMKAMEYLPGCVLTVAGESESEAYFGEVRALAGRLPKGSVEIHPRFVDESEIAGFFDRTHLVVLPYTEFASQSGVLHQALAHGRPVVASDLGGLGESVREWGIGGLVAPNDGRALARAIETTLAPDAYRAATAATLLVRDRFTWRSMAEATLEAYRFATR